MELLRNVVVLVHLVGFAVTFGAWVAEADAASLTSAIEFPDPVIAYMP